MTRQDDQEEYLKDAMRECRVPEHNFEGFINYVVYGIRPGSFLEAVLANDIMESFGREDAENRRYLFNICTFIYNNLPS